MTSRVAAAMPYAAVVPRFAAEAGGGGIALAVRHGRAAVGAGEGLGTRLTAAQQAGAEVERDRAAVVDRRRTPDCTHGTGPGGSGKRRSRGKRAAAAHATRSAFQQDW